MIGVLILLCFVWFVNVLLDNCIFLFSFCKIEVVFGVCCILNVNGLVLLSILLEGVLIVNL